jgi:protein-disulfide isomerase
MSLLRRTLLALAAGAALAFPAAAADRMGAAEASLGNLNAKVKVVEYASVTCPHCAEFHNEVFAAFKAKYIDTGQVHFTLREFPTSPVEVSVAGFLIARCGGPERYFSVIDALFKAQAEMYASRDASKFLQAGASAAGLDEAGIKACLDDDAALDAMRRRVSRAANVEKVEATPTFVIGEQKLQGVQSLAQLDAVIQPLLAR